jgi:anthranilate 1,2-dioxygenase small subunit
MPTVDVAKIDSNLLDRIRIDEFYAEYANCLDEDRLEAWPDFFLADCTYGVWPRENADAGLPVALFYCRNQNMLRDRVIAHREANFFPLHWNRHFISAVRIVEKKANEFTVRSNYLIVQTRQDGVSFIHQTGTAHDRIVDAGGVLKIAERKIIYDTLRVQTLFVTPV